MSKFGIGSVIKTWALAGFTAPSVSLPANPFVAKKQFSGLEVKSNGTDLDAVRIFHDIL